MSDHTKLVVVGHISVFTFTMILEIGPNGYELKGSNSRRHLIKAKGYPNIESIILIQWQLENYGQGKTWSMQTDTDEATSNHSRIHDILSWIVAIFTPKTTTWNGDLVGML